MPRPIFIRAGAAHSLCHGCEGERKRLLITGFIRNDGISQWNVKAVGFGSVSTYMKPIHSLFSSTKAQSVDLSTVSVALSTVASIYRAHLWTQTRPDQYILYLKNRYIYLFCIHGSNFANISKNLSINIFWRSSYALTYHHQPRYDLQKG